MLAGRKCQTGDVGWLPGVSLDWMGIIEQALQAFPEKGKFKQSLQKRFGV